MKTDSCNVVEVELRDVPVSGKIVNHRKVDYRLLIAHYVIVADFLLSCAQTGSIGCGMHAGRTSIVLDTNAEKMLGLSLELIFVALLWAQSGYAQNLSALLTPLAFNASQGSETTFYCSVTGTRTLLWQVDNEILLGVNNNRGIRFTQPVAVTGISGSFQSNLTISATPENDGSMVQCVAAMIPGDDVLSRIASYRVQGSVVALVFILYTP